MSGEARRLEELTLNSSAPPGQLLYDGWLLRLAPGKARRARSVNAVYAGALPLEEKIARCERVYGAAGLPALFRLTPFSQPPALDAALERRGYARVEATAVESAPIPPEVAMGSAGALPLADWVEAVGALRGSPRAHRAAHRARLEGLPLACLPLAIAEGGRNVATGLAVIEEDWAGLFDIATAEDRRGRGHGHAMVSALLAAAHGQGARNAYLQVSEDNEAARRIYRRFGFRARYTYWYRLREGGSA